MTAPFNSPGAARHEAPHLTGGTGAPSPSNLSEIGAAAMPALHGPTEAAGAPNRLTHSRIARVSGEAFDADQIGWVCDECGLSEYGCECEPVAMCACEAKPADDYCSFCDDGLVDVEHIAPGRIAV